MKDNLIQWIRDWFKNNGPKSPAVIGISGGGYFLKDFK